MISKFYCRLLANEKTDREQGAKKVIYSLPFGQAEANIILFY